MSSASTFNHSHFLLFILFLFYFIPIFFLAKFFQSSPAEQNKLTHYQNDGWQLETSAVPSFQAL